MWRRHRDERGPRAKPPSSVIFYRKLEASRGALAVRRWLGGLTRGKRGSWWERRERGRYGRRLCASYRSGDHGDDGDGLQPRQRDRGASLFGVHPALSAAGVG